MSDARTETREGLAGTALAGLLLASAQAPLGSTMIAVALPSISRDLGRDLALSTSLLVTSYLIVNIIGQSPGGKLSDALGHSRTVRMGMALQASGAALGIVATGLGVLVVSRCTMALGGALVVPATMALLRVHVAAERRGRVFGLVGATMGLSAAIGPPLGGELVSRFGWRAIFVAPLPALAIAATLLRISALPTAIQRSSATPSLGTFDWPGSALFAAALTALVVGSKMHGAGRGLTLAGSVTVLAAFVLWELRAKSPVLDLHLFRRRAFTAGSLVVGLQNFAMYGLLFQLPQFFQQIRGSTPKEVGRVLFSMMIAMFVGSPLGGRLADRFGARRSALLGAVVMVAGILWVENLAAFQVPRDAAPALMVLGFGLGLSGAPAQAAAMSDVGVEQSGMAAGATSTIRYLGGIASILVLGVILGSHGKATVEAHVTAVRISAFVAALSILLSAALPGSVVKKS